MRSHENHSWPWVVGSAVGVVAGTIAYRRLKASHVPTRQPLRQLHGDGAAVDAHRGILVRRSVTVRATATELYQFWRSLSNLPRIMRHLRSVTEHPSGRSQWVARGPAGITVKWDAEIITDSPGECIAWKSVNGAAVQNAGSVRFQRAPGERGTEIHVELAYDPPAGAFGVVVAKLLGEEPDLQIREDLRRFKQFMEAGEVATTEGQPVGEP